MVNPELNSKNHFYYIVPEHFHKLANSEAEILLKRSLLSVEIEVFSYCNRQCWFCPNKFIDRHSENKYMDEELYIRILKELASIGYSRKISYSRFNEPLSDRIILTRLHQAHEILPGAVLHTNTNGDYLNENLLKELYEAGLRSLSIQVYLKESEDFKQDYVKEKIQRKIDSLNLKGTYVKNPEYSDDEWIEQDAVYDGMDIKIYARNFRKNMCDRGGSLDKGGVQRKSVCHVPFYHMYVDYNGMAVPCCNIRSDYDRHKNCVIGDLNKQSLVEIYNSEKAIEWRRNIFNWGEINFSPCNSCSFGDLSRYVKDYTEWNSHYIGLIS